MTGCPQVAKYKLHPVKIKVINIQTFPARRCSGGLDIDTVDELKYLLVLEQYRETN